VFARFGARAAVVEALPRLLPAAEPEAGDLFATVFAREEIEAAPGLPPRASAVDGHRFTARASREGQGTARDGDSGRRRRWRPGVDTQQG